MKNSHSKSLILIASAFLLLGAGCSTANNTSPIDQVQSPAVNTEQTNTAPTTVGQTPTTTTTDSKTTNVTYNLAEVAKHNNENDCWVVIEGNIYNVTSYIPYHPAGPQAIIRNCGKDATNIFNMKHSPDKKQQLTRFFVAPLQ